MTSARPTPAQQLRLLQKLQKLFDEADFTATYKFALLMSLSDLAVESGREGGFDLELTMRQISEKFIEYYWPQSAPYSSGRSGTRPGVLSQNLGAQAAVINELSELRDVGVRTLREAKVCMAN